MIKVLYLFTSCKKSGPIQQMLNIIKNADRDIFDISLITIYPENDDKTSVLKEYLPFVKHYYVPLNKSRILFGRCGDLKKIINDICPDVIHTLGVFPDYVIEKLGYKNHTFTCRNYVFDDYPDEYGFILGNILAKIHLKAIVKCHYVQCCSESLHNIYLEKLSLNIPYITNGVDVSKYSRPDDDKRTFLRQKLALPTDKTIWIYGGVFNGRKNQSFLLDSVINCRHFNDSFILLPGGGDNYEFLKNKYKDYKNILLPGNVKNMNEYLMASDLYLSTSKSEGMPNGVLEALATGLPVLLSDIKQHVEILDGSEKFGITYKQDDKNDFIKRFDWLYENNDTEMRDVAVKIVNDKFSANKMSLNYQNLYKTIKAETGK